MDFLAKVVATLTLWHQDFLPDASKKTWNAKLKKFMLVEAERTKQKIMAWVSGLRQEMKFAAKYCGALGLILVLVWLVEITQIRFDPLTNLSLAAGFSIVVMWCLWRLSDILASIFGTGIGLVSRWTFFRIFGNNAAPISALLTTAAILFIWLPKP